MEDEVMERRRQIDKLDNFLKSSRSVMESITSSLGWSMDRLESGAEEMVQCPLQPGHHMPSRSLPGHLEKCTLRSEGYDSDDEFLSYSELSSSPAVLIDKEIQGRILQDAAVQNATEIKELPLVPRTLDRYLVELTAAERSALHDFVLSETRSKAISTAVTDDLNLPFPEDKRTRPKSKLELLAEQRDAKRRRVNYKKVHTGRKSYTEVLRELIENQMEHMKN